MPQYVRVPLSHGGSRRFNPYNAHRKTATWDGFPGGRFGFFALPTTLPPRRTVPHQLAVLCERDDRPDSRLDLPLRDGVVELGHLLRGVTADLLTDDGFDVSVPGQVLKGAPHRTGGDSLLELDRLSDQPEWLVQRRGRPEPARLRREEQIRIAHRSRRQSIDVPPQDCHQVVWEGDPIPGLLLGRF